jgi:hypothetical protein
MDPRLDRLIELVTDLRVVAGRHEEILERQEASLREHMRRSDQLEMLVDEVRRDVDTRVAPIQAHVSAVRAVGRFLLISLSTIGTLVGVAAGVAKWWRP